MKRIGILSDTHGYIDDSMLRYFEACNEIWHAGDIGDLATADTIAAFKPLKAVYGNIDNQSVRISYPLINRFSCEDVDVFIKHIVGYPGKYDYSINSVLGENPPKLLIAGHSHILKVQFDKKHNLLFINPGAAGKSGFHQVRTMARITIDSDKIKDLEIIELGKR